MAPPNEKILRTLAANIGLGWKKIGTFLGFTWPKLQQFEFDNPHSIEDAIFQMFYMWRNKQPRNANSTEELRAALKKADEHLLCDEFFPSRKCVIEK